jgi:hypothetical protein
MRRAEWLRLWHGMDDHEFRARLKWKSWMVFSTFGLAWQFLVAIFQATRDTYREMRAERKTKTKVCWEMGCTPSWLIGRGREDNCIRCGLPVPLTKTEVQIKRELIEREQ